MDRLQTVIDDVAGWDETESGADSILRLHGGLALKAARDDPRYEAWRYAAQRRVPVYVQFDPATTLIAALFMGERQLVNSIEAPSNRKAIVTFERAPSFYYVNGNQAGAAEMIARLSDAATRHEPVLVISHPSTLEILAVRPVAD